MADLNIVILPAMQRMLQAHEATRPNTLRESLGRFENVELIEPGDQCRIGGR